jgi:hypothetical protein
MYIRLPAQAGGKKQIKNWESLKTSVFTDSQLQNTQYFS